MGTQQILLIVLSVIIVGAAIAVGIQMFNNQSYSANKTAIAADAQSYASQIVQYYKTPVSQGGAGGDVANMTAAKVGPFIGFLEGEEEGEWGAGVYGIENDNGIYTVANASSAVDGEFTIVITGLGKEVKGELQPQILTTITFPEGVITAVASDV